MRSGSEREAAARHSVDIGTSLMAAVASTGRFMAHRLDTLHTCTRRPEDGWAMCMVELWAWLSSQARLSHRAEHGQLCR